MNILHDICRKCIPSKLERPNKKFWTIEESHFFSICKLDSLVSANFEMLKISLPILIQSCLYHFGEGDSDIRYFALRLMKALLKHSNNQEFIYSLESNTLMLQHNFLESDFDKNILGNLLVDRAQVIYIYFQFGFIKF